MAVYCWGNCIHGELGLGGIEEEFIETPRKMDWSDAPNLVQAACGCTHTLLLTNEGKVYSCGNNDHGQLGHDRSRKRPQLITSLNNYSITQVSCGLSFSLALNDWGQVFSWGSDNSGQLGQEQNEPINLNSPKIIRTLATKHIVQISCGYNHSVALTNNGDLYAWGANNYGQLGLGNFSEKVSKPTEITSLAGIPMSLISCGGNHSFAVSKSGAVFGWGKNTCGQLGLNDEESRAYPTQLKTLRSLGVRYISCGEDFSVFLTVDGGVFTCGSGTYGQLGHGSCHNESVPRMVAELMGSTITQITCGSRHTLALVASRGRVYAFGLGCSGQLGRKNSNSSPTPQVVLGPWVSPGGTSLKEDQKINLNSATTVKKIYSGGDQCMVSTTEFNKKIPADDYRVYEPKTQILFLTEDSAKMYSQVPKDTSVDLDLLANIETIFKSQACLNGSFLISTNGGHLCCTSKNHGINLEEATTTFEYIRKIENDSLKQIIWDCVTNDLLKSLKPSPADVETLRIYLILPLYHEFVNVKNYEKLQTPFSKAVLSISSVALKILSKWWAKTSEEYFERIVGCYKDVVSYIIHFKFPKSNRNNNEREIVSYEPNLLQALDLLCMLHNINHCQRIKKISYETFHINDLMEFVDLQQDYLRWATDFKRNCFYLCNYPFLFDAKAKTLLLQTDQAIQMHSAMQNAATQAYFSTSSWTSVSQFIVWNVSRENIVQDTLREIGQCGPNDLKKPLKVKFHGEEAEDAGGVRKEFFMLLLKNILDPKYGMFKEYSDSRVMWFADYSFEVVEMYMLIGAICGLAIYNFTIINLPFSLALYKKLLNESVDMSDLKDLSPTLANSMQSILDYDGDDFESVFLLNFEITREFFGEIQTIPLKPNGDKIPVTIDNREEFVDLYIDFIFNKSVEEQFKAFSKGFLKVCGGRVLSLFKPQELMAVVVGSEEYDWHALESETEYKNGYSSGDQTIRWFWEVFHELPITEKKKFLLFLTGSDRIPITGMKINIQPTNDEKCLPVAHTCFNLLDLPRYSTKERLKYKLLQAIQQTQGFSLV